MGQTSPLSIALKIQAALKGGEILLIVPPFVTSRTPVLGPLLLQAIARKQGRSCDVLHLNLLLAATIGPEQYESICYGQPFRMLGERLFARAACGLPSLGQSPELCLDPLTSVFGNERYSALDAFEYKYYDTDEFGLDSLLELEKICYAFIEEAARSIAQRGYKLVGCSTNWEQNNCCIALLNRIKAQSPETLTLIGGSNCEAEMAEGIASLSESIDYIFSGESDESFARFLREFAAGKRPAEKIIDSPPCEDVESLPLPDYESYFRQRDLFFGEKAPPLQQVQLGYESSRGCWWGKCYFCGLNGKRERFRQKSAATVARELDTIASRYPGQRILTVDKVMPISYQKELLPLLGEKENMPPLTYEQRPDLSFEDLSRLKQAGVNIIKTGIESLSTGLLKVMNKGVTASQNLLLLRHACSLGLAVSWNLLWGFPGDEPECYEETLALLPLLRHLQPPDVFRHLSLDRFCAYFEEPERFQITGLRPWKVYTQIYPEWAEVEKLAYRFIGDYPSAANQRPELIRRIAQEVEIWKTGWKSARLLMLSFAGSYIIHDSRGLDGAAQNHVLDRSQAQAIMNPAAYSASEQQQWAVEHKLGVVLDERYVPLVTARPELLKELQEELQELGITTGIGC